MGTHGTTVFHLICTLTFHSPSWWPHWQLMQCVQTHTPFSFLVASLATHAMCARSHSILLPSGLTGNSCNVCTLTLHSPSTHAMCARSHSILLPSDLTGNSCNVCTLTLHSPSTHAMCARSHSILLPSGLTGNSCNVCKLTLHSPSW